MGYVLVGAAAGLIGYLIGLPMGGLLAENKFDKMREEMQVDDEEKDAWDELFGGGNK